MKLALQRKASKKLVDRREDVISLVHRAGDLRPATVYEAVGALKELEEAADELGLPLTGDEWGERLVIKKKGGGMHFDDELRAVASTAYMRSGVLHTAVTWHEQLVGRGKQIESAVGAFRTKGASGASLSKVKMIERCTELLTQLQKTIADIFNDASFSSSLREMERLAVPQRLDADANDVRCQSVLLAEFAHEIAQKELAGLHAEKKLTQRFRAPQTLAVLSAAATLMRAVDAAARPAAHVNLDHLAELESGIEEVRPMAGSAQLQDDDELDDEI